MLHKQLKRSKPIYFSFLVFHLPGVILILYFLVMRLSLSTADILIFLFFYSIITFLGFFPFIQKRNSKKVVSTDYLFAGRKLSLPFFVASLVATWYGNILGIGEFVYRYGLVAWFCFGIVYYFAAFIYAFWVARKIHQSSALTVAEQISSKFGENAGFLASLGQLIIAFPAVYVLMVGTFINSITGINFFSSIILGTIFSFVYIGIGGFKSNILTNSFQFVLMYLGFGVFAYFSLKANNFEFEIFKSLPPSHLNFFGDVSWQFLISWFFISLQTFIDPSFYQRCISAKTNKIAKTGILVSIFFWFLFDSMTIYIGLVSRATFNNIEPLFAYPYLLEVIVPPFWKGIVLVAMLATIVSTMDSYIFLSALIIGKDILGKLNKTKHIELSLRTKTGLIFSALFSIFLSYAIPSAIDLIYKTSAIAVPALFYPLILSFSRKKYLKDHQIRLLIITSSFFTLIFSLTKDFFKGKILQSNISQVFYFEPMVIGFLWSTFLLTIMIIYNKTEKNFTTTTLL